MHKHILTITGAACLALASAQAQNIVQNSGFESGTGNSFDTTDDWSNLGVGTQNRTPGQITARGQFAGAFVISDTFSGLVDNQYNVATAASDFDTSAFGPTVHFQNTGYTIQSDDSFDFSFNWNADPDWDDGTVDSQVRFVLYATSDNSATGTVEWSSIYESGASVTQGVAQAAGGTSSIVTSGAAGQELLVSIFGFDNDGTVPARGFATIDDIEVTVVPEPSAFAALAGILALGFVMFRRRG